MKDQPPEDPRVRFAAERTLLAWMPDSGERLKAGHAVPSDPSDERAGR
jgi:uncharacterized membrane protein YidH (DUF202 family)